MYVRRQTQREPSRVRASTCERDALSVGPGGQSCGLALDLQADRRSCSPRTAMPTGARHTSLGEHDPSRGYAAQRLRYRDGADTQMRGQETGNPRRDNDNSLAHSNASLGPNRGPRQVNIKRSGGRLDVVGIWMHGSGSTPKSGTAMPERVYPSPNQASFWLPSTGPHRVRCRTSRGDLSKDAWGLLGKSAFR